MATIEQLSTALINADKAGDVDAARALAAEIGRMRASQPAQPAQPAAAPPQAPANTDLAGSIDAFGRGAANMAGMGFMDEIGAGADYLGSHILPWRTAKTYDQALQDTRSDDARVASEHPVANAAGMTAGVVGSATGLGRLGLSATANAVKAGKGLVGVTKAAVKEGTLLGGLQGFGSGDDGIENRLYNAGTHALIGGATGALLPTVMTGVTGAVGAATRPITSLFRPAQAADRAMGEVLRRSGSTADEIANSIRGAQADGQDMYTAADALGNSGQRALVPAVRTPNDARQEITNAILNRQTGQGERLSNYLSEGFAAPDTAAQRAASLTKARDTAANADYGALRASMGNAPIWGDDLLALTSRPSVKQAIGDASDIAAERGYTVTNPFQAGENGTLSLPEGTAPTFGFWDTVKRGIDRQIAKDPTNRDLIATKNQLVKLLDSSAPEYAAAREPFSKASKAIDAIETGSAAASGRSRAADNIPVFQAMSPEEQAAYRAGYADPHIARVESASMSPSTNKARPLITQKTSQEFPAFAAPGEADRLGNRIGREQRMFETANTALGGSKTADNLADMTDAASFDPEILKNLASFNWGKAALTGAKMAFNLGKGLPPRAIENVGRQLMETNPDIVAANFKRIAQTKNGRDNIRAIIAASLLNGTVAGETR